MKILKLSICLIIVISLSFFRCVKPKKELSQISPFIAFSLKNAFNSIDNKNLLTLIQTFGGITRFIGLVIDRESEDIILVGFKDDNSVKANFDDFVVALRSKIIHNEYPLVSIDPLTDSYTTRRQNVRFDGRLENTGFGQKFLECDIILKKYSLQKAEIIPELPSYNKLLENDIIKAINKEGANVKSIKWITDEHLLPEINRFSGSTTKNSFEFQARFWFCVPNQVRFIRRPPGGYPNVYMINELNLGLMAEQVYSSLNDSVEARKNFAELWTINFDKIVEKHPALKHLKILYDLTALANQFSDSSEVVKKYDFMQFFLNNYKVKYYETPTTYQLEEIVGNIELENGLVNLVSISGGIRFEEDVTLLNEDDYGLLKKVVVESRPELNSLVWNLPLVGWKAPNTKDVNEYYQTNTNKYKVGSTFTVKSVLFDPTKRNTGNVSKSFTGFSPLVNEPDPLKGVQMKFEIDDGNFTKIDSLKNLKDGILEEFKNKTFKSK